MENNWISVETLQFPPVNTSDEFDAKNLYSVKVLVIEQGETYFAKYLHSSESWSVFGRSGNIQVTHWMPIPPKPIQ